MPKSRTREKKPRVLRGIPASVLDRAPRNFDDRQKALWAEAYLCGSTGKPYVLPRGTGIEPQLRRAHWQGQEFSTSEEARTFVDNGRRSANRAMAGTIHRGRQTILQHRHDLVPQNSAWPR